MLPAQDRKGLYMAKAPVLSLVYRVDRRFRILSTCSAWDTFAVENAAESASREHVVGTLLWDHISCLQTQHIYRTLVRQAFTQNRSIGLAFRCDSPHLRRFMHMEIVPEGAGECEFRTFLIKTEPRDAVTLLDPQVTRTDDIIVMCSWCKKISVEGEGWLDVENAVQILRLFDVVEIPSISHGICPACYANALAAIQHKSPHDDREQNDIERNQIH
jgi:hypothetical protein